MSVLRDIKDKREFEKTGQYSLYGGTPPHEPVDTSREAAESVKPSAGRLRQVVFAMIQASGRTGVTDREIEDALDMLHQTASARRRELVLEGRVAWSGDYRDTPSGRRARVWVAKGEA